MTEHSTPNVDPTEVAKFEALASRWWDPDSEFKPLHDINPLRCNYIDQAAGLAGKKVLDVGCGGGLLSEAMAQRGADVMGIDMGEAPLNVAKLHALESGVNINYQRIPVEQLAAEQPASFDVVTCLEMLEHVPDPASIMKACATLVKPGGKVFFSTINRNPKAYLFAIVGAEYILKWLPIGTHEWEKFVKPEDLKKILIKHNLTLNKLNGMSFNIIDDKWNISEDLSVNYIGEFVKN